MHADKSNRGLFWYFAKTLMVIRRNLHRWRRRLWLFLLRVEATGSLHEFRVGHGLRIDAPIRIGGGKGTLKIAHDVWLGWDAAQKLGKGTILLQPRLAESVITIGACTQMSNNISIVSMGHISIGSHCLIGDMTSIYDCDFHEVDPSKRGTGAGTIAPVVIGDNVWIGSRVLILRGVSIGDNSVIGAGSTVTKSIPANCLAAGSPARVIRPI